MLVFAQKGHTAEPLCFRKYLILCGKTVPIIAPGPNPITARKTMNSNRRNYHNKASVVPNNLFIFSDLRYFLGLL